MLLKAVIFDWAGTLVDPGCRAPVAAYLDVFRAMNLPLEEADARIGMGLPKRDHIRAMLTAPHIAAAFHTTHGSAPTRAQEDDLYARVTDAMCLAATRHSDAILGAAETVAWLRDRGVRIGSTTGYPRSVMNHILPAAEAQGIKLEIVVCSDEADDPRPGPGQVRGCLVALGSPSPGVCLKVDDTPAGIAEGRAAGLITLGVTASGNTPSFAGLTPEPDLVCARVAEMPTMIDRIESLCALRASR